MDDNGNPIKKQFHTLYFGDYDPNGRLIDMNLSLDLFSRRDLAIENLKNRDQQPEYVTFRLVSIWLSNYSRLTLR